MSAGDAEDDSALYDSAYFLDSRYARQGLTSQYYWARRFYAEVIKRNAAGGRLLEIGCGLGEVLARLQDRFEAFALDVSPFAVDTSAKRAPRATVALGGLEAVSSYAWESFDVIVAIHVVEHLADPEDFFAAIEPVLKPGGLLFLATPNLDSPSHKVRGSRWYGFGDPTHISMKPASDWLQLIRRHGFRIRQAFGDGLWDTQYVPWLPARLQLVIFGMPAILQAVICRPFIPVRFSESLLVLAEKAGSSSHAGG